MWSYENTVWYINSASVSTGYPTRPDWFFKAWKAQVWRSRSFQKRRDIDLPGAGVANNIYCTIGCSPSGAPGQLHCALAGYTNPGKCWKQISRCYCGGASRQYQCLWIQAVPRKQQGFTFTITFYVALHLTTMCAILWRTCEVLSCSDSKGKLQPLPHEECPCLRHFSKTPWVCRGPRMFLFSIIKAAVNDVLLLEWALNSSLSFVQWKRKLSFWYPCPLHLIRTEDSMRRRSCLL